MSEAINERDNNAASVSGWESLLTRPPIIQKAPEHKVAEGYDSATSVVQPSTAPQKNDGDYSSWMRPSSGQTSNHATFAPERDENRAPISAGHAEKDNRSIWTGIHRPMPQKPESAAKAPEKIPLEPQINQSAVASAEDINQLLEYPRFGEFAFEGLSKKTREKLDVEFASIEEDERKDYANPYKLERHHTRDEYDRFRQEVTNSAIKQELSNLDAATLSKLKEQLEEIDYDEKRGWRGHTKEDFDHFRQETIVNALRTRLEQPEQINQPQQPKPAKQLEQPSQSEPPLAAPEQPERPQRPNQPGKPEQPKQPAEPGNNSPETNPIEQPESTKPEQPSGQPGDTNTETDTGTSTEEDEATRAAERAAIEAELKQLKQDLQRNSDEMLKYEPLSAVMVKYEPLSAEDVARSLANRDIDRNLKRANFIKRLWMGKMFRRHYVKSLSKEYKGAKGIADDYNKAIGHDSREIRPIMGTAALDEPQSLSELIAFEDVSQDSERLPEAKNEITQAITRAIGEFVTAMQNDAGPGDNINIAAENSIRRKFVENIKNIHGMDIPNSNNYIRIAYQVLKLVKNDVALDNALEKINFYNFRILNTQFGKKGYDLERIYDRIDKMKTLDARRRSTTEFYYEKRDAILEEESPYIRQETFGAAA